MISHSDWHGPEARPCRASTSAIRRASKCAFVMRFRAPKVCSHCARTLENMETVASFCNFRRRDVARIAAASRPSGQARGGRDFYRRVAQIVKVGRGVELPKGIIVICRPSDRLSIVNSPSRSRPGGWGRAAQRRSPRRVGSGHAGRCRDRGSTPATRAPKTHKTNRLPDGHRLQTRFMRTSPLCADLPRGDSR